MVETGMTAPVARGAPIALQAAMVGALWIAWEALARSGLFFEGVVPSSLKVGRALVAILLDPALYGALLVTSLEVAAALAIGCGLGLAFGLLGGAARIVGEAFEPYIHYLAPTPKIVFLPILLLFFGIGVAMKIALGALSAFFPMAIATLSGVRQVDPVLVRVGRSLQLTRAQMALRIYLPAMRRAVLTGVRLSFGFALIGVLLGEIKMSNRGLGFLAIQFYNHLEIAEMYALLLVVFALAAGVNGLIGRLTPQA
jgi:NitT/TauT family transport system permease protein